MWEDVHRLHANTQRFTCRTRASVDLGVSRGPWNQPHEDTEDAAYTGADSRRRVRTSRFLAVLLTQRTDMFSHEAYMLLKEDHEHCVQMSAVNAFKGQSDGFARMGCVIYSVDRQGVTED